MGSRESNEPGTRLFVGNLSWGTTNESLANAFTLEKAKPIEAKVIVDRYSGRSRGFGFVTFGSVEEATAAKEALNDQPVDGREIRIDYAKPNG